MGDPISSYATAGIALRVSGALNPHHHDKLETPSVGKVGNMFVKKIKSITRIRLDSSLNPMDK
jgi:hypothetical protein